MFLSSKLVNQQPLLVHTWRAHDGAIESMEVMERNPQLFLVSVSLDHSARLWTSYGDCVGSFGQEQQWDLNDPLTFQINRCDDTEQSLINKIDIRKN